MNTKILETLEFNKIKALFEPHLLTEQGLEELKGLAPTANAWTISVRWSKKTSR